MATAANLNNNFAVAQTATFGSLGDDAPILPAWGDPLPQRYVFREIDYELDANGYLQFLFRNPGLALPVGAGGIDEVIAMLMNQPLSPAIESFFKVASTADRETPLDVKLKNSSAYIIYRLARNRNMYFAPDVPAVTHKDEDDQPYCGELKHVGLFGPDVDPVDGCRLIYFMAKPRAIDYAHSLNFKVRLLQKPHFGSPLPRVLDIVLDPDIRHPGGSET